MRLTELKVKSFAMVLPKELQSELRGGSVGCSITNGCHTASYQASICICTNTSGCISQTCQSVCIACE